MHVGYEIMNDSKNSQSTNIFSKFFDPVVECYGRGALTGLASFWFVFSTSHFLQKPIQRRIGYPIAGSLFVSTTLAGTATYFITKNHFEKFNKIRESSENKD